MQPDPRPAAGAALAGGAATVTPGDWAVLVAALGGFAFGRDLMRPERRWGSLGGLVLGLVLGALAVG